VLPTPLAALKARKVQHADKRNLRAVLSVDQPSIQRIQALLSVRCALAGRPWLCNLTSRFRCTTSIRCWLGTVDSSPIIPWFPRYLRAAATTPERNSARLNTALRWSLPVMGPCLLFALDDNFLASIRPVRSITPNFFVVSRQENVKSWTESFWISSISVGRYRSVSFGRFSSQQQ
jgi:hypothetical protein